MILIISSIYNCYFVIFLIFLLLLYGNIAVILGLYAAFQTDILPV